MQAQPIMLQQGMVPAGIPVIQSGALPAGFQTGTLPAGLQAGTIQRTIPVIQAGTLPAGATTQQGIAVQPGSVINSTLPSAGPAAGGSSKKPGPRHIPLARCRALYLGSAVPLDTSQGLEAVQGPLRERYPFEGGGDVHGIDVWLSVFSSGTALNYVNDKNGNTWFPISTLYVCAAVKCVIEINPNGDKNPKFVALDSEEAKASRHPPMFACIMRRTKGVKVLECHVFICKSNQAAMALVQSCTHAYEHKEGWTSEAPSAVQRPNQPTRLVAADKIPEVDVPQEFYQQPPKQGFFYTSDRGLVKNYNVFGAKNEDKKSGQESQNSGAQQQPPQQAGPPGAPVGAGPQPMMYPGYAPPGGPPTGQPMPPGMMGPPGPPLPPMLPPHMMGGPPPGPLGPPGPPGMGGYPGTLPPPPAGYFADWDRHEGRPIAVLGDKYGNTIADYHVPPPPRGRDDYQRGPPGPPPGPPRDDRRHGGKSGGRRHSPPRDKRRKSPPRRRGHSPPRHHRGGDAGGHYGGGEPHYSRHHHRPRSPPVDYERSGQRRGEGPPPPRAEYYARGQDRYDGPDPDFMVYAPQYKDRFPEDFDRRREGRDHVEYKSTFNPEIVMKGSKEYRGDRGDRGDRNRYRSPERGHYGGGGRGGGDGGGGAYDFGDEDEDVYRYERDLPIHEDSVRYPRGDRAFERSLAEERETIGDQYSDRGNFDTTSENIEYGMFRGNGGRYNDDFERGLGYLP